VLKILQYIGQFFEILSILGKNFRLDMKKEQVLETKPLAVI